VRPKSGSGKLRQDGPGGRCRVGFSTEVSDRYLDIERPLVTDHLYEGSLLASLLNGTPPDPLPSIHYLPPPQAVAESGRFLAEHGLVSGSITGIHTGGRGHKKLALEKFMELGRQSLSRQEQVLFFFGPDEKVEIGLFREAGFICAAPESIDLFGGFLAHLKRFVSCDTGPMHMAAGAGVATLSIFLATDPERYAPQGSPHRHVGSIEEILNG